MSVRKIIGCLVILVLVVATGCSRRPSRLHQPAVDASVAGAKAIEMYGKDGKISGADLDRCPALKGALAKIDTDGDGAISASEITARIKELQDAKLGRVTVTCTVLRNGRPMAGASVEFMPEKFLGDDIKLASGTTDQNGAATISIPMTDRSDLPGVAPGFYRIGITKAGENIPTKYNTDTTLGQEVVEYHANYVFDLQY